MPLSAKARKPTAGLQAVGEREASNQELSDAIGDTRVQVAMATRNDEADTVEAEASVPAAEAETLRSRGWKVELPEPAGRGRHFGGINAVELHADRTLTGYADPRRTNAAVG